MLQQIRDPFGITHIGLTPWKGFTMLRIGDDEFERVFELIVNGFPVGASAFHCNVRTSRSLQPVTQCDEFLGRRSEAADCFLASMPVLSDKEAGTDPLFVDIQATTARIQDLQNVPPLHE